MKNAENGVYTECIHVYTKYTLLQDEDLVKSWQIIDRLQPGDIYELGKISEERKEIFTFCAKQYANTHHNITFNNDYTKIRKDEYLH